MKQVIPEPQVDNVAALLVLCIAVFVIIIIPLRVMAYGYLPPDDAMRHAAKVISGKDWGDILVLRPDVKMDTHPGWHSFLGVVNKFTGCGGEGLVICSFVFLFWLFCLIPFFFLRYPESWLATLLATNTVNTYFIWRLLTGRPFILTASLTLAVCFLWPRLEDKKVSKAALALFILLPAVCTWAHGSTWYLLLLLPTLCFFVSGHRLVAVRYALCTGAGVILGAMFTGHSVLFLQQNLSQVFLAFSGHPSQRMLVAELRSFRGDLPIVLFVAAMLIWRALRGEWDINRIKDPVFTLMSMCWMFGFFVWRFWLDWGMIAFLVWMSRELDDVFKRVINIASLRRITLSLLLAVPLFLYVTADNNSRGTWNLRQRYLLQDDERLCGWLPEDGGIIYSNDNTVYYQTFFYNPRAPWRYILGHEPGWMPSQDLVILRGIQGNNFAPESFEPWVSKMRPQDRMIVRSTSGEPGIKGLRWRYALGDLWIGKLPH